MKTVSFGTHKIRLRKGIPVQELPRDPSLTHISFFTPIGEEIIIKFDSRQTAMKVWQELDDTWLEKVIRNLRNLLTLKTIWKQQKENSEKSRSSIGL